MTVFRGFLVVGWAVLAIYTLFVVVEHGLNLLPVFFGDVARMGWPGQFNLDFLLMLCLSALWVGWRHRFSGLGCLLAVIALFGGAGFLYPYLLIEAGRAQGDMRQLLLGANA